jgi:hypothetical protein
MESSQEKLIRSIIQKEVSLFSSDFEKRHLSELDDPDGVINSKVHNIFIGALGDEIQFYSALVRSLDSSLGSLIEKMALAIAETHFYVTQHVEGRLYTEQTSYIAELLQNYLTQRSRPNKTDLDKLRSLNKGKVHEKRHASDYMLENRVTGVKSLIELKLGGDLDNKKARSEKEALLEQFCILSNEQGANTEINLHFATAYNRYGEGKKWKQERVLRFFSEDELLISADFWNFITQDSRGSEIILNEYKKQSHQINTALDNLKAAYVK